MSRERYAAEALNLIATIDADVEAAGRAMAAGGLTMHEAATNLQRALDSFPKLEDASIPLCGSESSMLAELHGCD